MTLSARPAPGGSRRRPALLALASVVLVSGCGAGARADAAAGAASSRPSSPGTSSSARAPLPPAAAGTVTKVLTVVLENHGSAAALRGMPGLAAMATTYGQTSHYRAVTHPSLPNYLALAGGSPSEVKDDGSPSAHAVPGPSVFDAALSAGASARTYAEDMPAPCTTENAGRYAVRHNPWTYYADAASRRACAVDDVPAGTLTAGALHDDVAAGRLPTVGMVVPDLCHDAHDCSLATADRWLAGWVAQVQQGPDWRAGRLALVVTFDEAEGGGDNTVLTVVAAPSVHAVVADGPLTHASWTHWMCDLAGAAAPRGSDSAPSLGHAFGL